MPRKPRSRRPVLRQSTGRDSFRYLRVSTEEQDDYSPDAQRGACMAHVAREGLTCVHEFTESRSAKVAGKRPEFAAMLELLRAGRVGIVVFDKVDRSTRNLLDYAALDQLVQTGSLEVHF